MRRSAIAGFTSCLGVLACTGCATGADEYSQQPTTRGNSGEGALSPTVMWRSGSRLRARVIDAGGGAATFTGFHDTQLDVDCTLQLAGDGTYDVGPELRLAAMEERLE